MSRSSAARPTARRWAAVGAVTATLTVVGAVLPWSAEAAPVSVTDWASLSAAGGAGNAVRLASDISHSGDTLTVGGSTETIDLNGHSLNLVGPTGGAAISVPSGIDLVVEDDPGGGVLSAVGGTGGAGVGVAPDATLTVSGAVTTRLSATGGTGGAGVGGSLGAPGGNVVVHDGIVTGVGGTGGAGIGGGAGGDAGSLLVTGGQASATGGPAGGAGIGGGAGGDGGPVTVSGGIVRGVGSGQGAGAGAGGGGAPGPTAVEVGARGELEVNGARAITPGTLDNAGTVDITGGSTLTVPAGVVVHNSGLIALNGTLGGLGTVHNTGAVVPTPTNADGQVTDDGQGPAGAGLYVTEHNYTIQFDLDGHGGTAPQDLHVYAQDIGTSAQTLPPAPPGNGLTCSSGWFTSAIGGTRVLDTTLLSSVTGSGPSTLELHRHCSVPTSVVTFDARGGSPTPPAQTVSDGAHAAKPAAPAKAGGRFVGWFTAATGGTKWNFADDTVTEALTLYAHYDVATPSSAPPISGSSTPAPPRSSPVATTTGRPSSPAARLAKTGTDAAAGLRAGLALLVAGGMLLLAGRRGRAAYVRRH